MFGPRSAGSALVLLMHETHRRLSGGAVRVRGGPGALTAAMADAARAAGAEIRTGVSVDRILDERRTRDRGRGRRRRDRRRHGCLRARSQDDVPSPHGSARPLARVRDTGAKFPGGWYRGENQPRVVGAPGVHGRRRMRRRCPAASTSAPDSTTSSGPSTTPSTANRPPTRGSTSRSPPSSIHSWRRRARMSCPSTSITRRRRFAPATGMRRPVRCFRGSSGRSSDSHRAFHGLVAASQVITPSGAGTRLRLSRRPHLPRRTGPRSALHDAPAARLRAIRLADPRPVPVRRRHASGWVHDRRQRPARGGDGKGHVGSGLRAPGSGIRDPALPSFCHRLPS